MPGITMPKEATAEWMGLPVDFDGDGYRSNVDCDDMDRSVHPLPEQRWGGDPRFEHPTVCPGIYQGLNLVVAPGTSGIRITGTGVTLDGQGSDRPAFQLNQVSQVTIEGFRILNYPLGSAVIQLNNSPLIIPFRT